MTKTDTKETGVAKGASKILLSASRDIPFNKLMLSQTNVRRVKAGVSIEELAQDIAHRTLLQSLTVRAVVDEDGAETGMFEIPAGGRRYRALELLVKQKRLARNAPIPCVVRTEGIAEEDSLAENVQRAPLHPLDQFRAFLTLREQKGQSEEEIAATFFVPVAVVKQRLRLATVSSKLLDVYAEEGLTLEQLMAFTVNPDHERQEQVWEAIQRSHSKDAAHIRRLLTEGAVKASDRRAVYAAAEYEAAGGPVMRDLFQADEGGWLQDVALLHRLVTEKLTVEAEKIAAEGWKWINVGIEFPYGHTYGLRGLNGTQPPLTAEQEAQAEALRAEVEKLEAEYEDAPEYPEEVEKRLEEIDEALTALDERPEVFEAADISIAGAFVSLDREGRLKVERGYVRPEDEVPLPDPAEAEAGDGEDIPPEGEADGGEAEEQDGPVPGFEDEPEEDGLKPLPDRLLTELSTYRTLALRNAVANDPGIAFLAVLHALVLKLLYPYGLDSCLEISPKMVSFGSQVPGLADSTLAVSIDERHHAWTRQLPQNAGELWDVLSGFDSDSRDALFAHCVSLTVNGVYEAYNRKPRALAHAGQLAEVLSVNLVEAGWIPTVDNYLGRVTKARIVEAVREAKGDEAAERIVHLKKGDMAATAEQLLAGTGWLPEPLRTKGVETLACVVQQEGETGDQAVLVTVSDSEHSEISEAVIDETHQHDIAAE